jgi:GR25 family glycosyltransferase involved in LPS biosynthesis
MDRGKTRRKRNLNIFNMPAYVVSMKERADRWKRFTDQPAIKAIKGLKRTAAINGKKLNYRTDKRISIRTRLNIFRNYRRSHNEIATLGAVGCSLSHIQAWKQFLKSGANMGLILEDDAIITESMLNTINDTSASLPSGWGIWILGCYRPNLTYEHLPTKPWNRVYGFTASHSYILTRDTAKQLLDDALPVETHIDHYMCSAAILKDILIVQNPNVHIEFFKKDHGPRTADSNTSQHKKSGCPTCNVPDDHSQLYKNYTRKGAKGMRVKGLINGEQSKRILTLKSGKKK